MKKKIDRRNFLRSSAAIGAGLFLGPQAQAQTGGNPDDINVALLGAGEQ